MRTIGFRSNVLFILAAAVGLLAALGRPWYADGAGADSGGGAHRRRPRARSRSSSPRLAREFTSRAAARRAGTRFTSTDTILAVLVGDRRRDARSAR